MLFIPSQKQSLKKVERFFVVEKFYLVLKMSKMTILFLVVFFGK